MGKFTDEEAAIQDFLARHSVEHFVAYNWDAFSPTQIARALTIKTGREISPRWVESIHRRLTRQSNP